MPIDLGTGVHIFDQDEFHALDRRVMGVVFAVHNEFGRLLDEALFKRAIAQRCSDQGIDPVAQEVRIQVTHETFRKDYFIDLLFGQGVMVEAKTAETLSPSHRAQSLNYLLLAGLKHGRLINLRPERVQHEYISTTLSPAERRQFKVVDNGWREPDEASAWLKHKCIELLQDWGAFLEVSLYREAIVHFLGGPTVACPAIGIFDGVRLLGHQSVCLLTKDTIFACTAVTHALDQIWEHQRRFLSHTQMQRVQWVNLNRAQIEFCTISK